LQESLIESLSTSGKFSFSNFMPKKFRYHILRNFSAFILTLFLVINPLGITGFTMGGSHAQSPSRPYVVLVNGYQDCCVWSPSNRGIYMGTVLKELEKRGAEFRLVPWDSFRDGARQRSSTSNDAAFLREAASFINNTLDRNRPLILIGHSFGGDSLLSLAPRINRTIQFLGVIDPTAAGGLREPVTRRGVPSNVKYFFNRWQQNAVASGNAVPFDSRLVNGSISGCRAGKCDQQEQSLARREDGSEMRVSCGSLEVSCPGYQAWPGGSNGTKAKRITHNDMPSDAYLQAQMVRAINTVITSSSPSVSSPVSGYFRRNDRPEVYFVNAGTRTACHVQNPSQMEVYGEFGQVKVVQGDGFRAGTTFTGSCLWPDGLYISREKPEVYYLSNNWKSACWVRTSERVNQLGGWGKVRLINGTSKESLTVGRTYSDRC
jgi:hypothetical protein